MTDQQQDQQPKVDPAWKAMLEGLAIEFVQKSEQSFQQGVKKAAGLTAVRTKQNMSYVRSVFLDAATGLFVMILGSSFGDVSLELEEQAVKILRAKIRDMRAQRFKAKMEAT